MSERDFARDVQETPRVHALEERAALAEYAGKLRGMTPRPFATVFLIAVNVVVFVAMAIRGVNPFEPTVQSLVDWGANFGPRTAAGDWWRPITAMFVHVGILHLAMNMWAFWGVGLLVERMLGTPTFLLVYVLSGWAGSLVSMMVRPFVVSAGASGAIFGVFGVLFAVMLRPRRSIPASVFRTIRSSALAFLAFNLFIGVTSSRVDLAAHLGGLVFGAVSGVIANHEPTAAARRAARGRIIALGVAGIALLGAATRSVQGRIEDVSAVVKRFGPVEGHVLSAYQAAATKAKNAELSDAAFAAVLEEEVIRPWHAARPNFVSLRDMPPATQQLASDILKYWDLREAGWNLMVEGLASHDSSYVERGYAKEREAEAVLRRRQKEDATK